MSGPVDELVAEGRAAIRRGDAGAARAAFSDAMTQAATGAVLEGAGHVAYLEREYTEAIAAWERAYGAYRAEGEHAGAVRVARKLAFMYGSVVGEPAVMRGWIARAQTLLGGDPGSREGGWVSHVLGMFEPDPAKAERYFRAALEVARRVGDTDLESVTLARLGTSLVRVDRTEEGMLLLDEALAAVAGEEVEDFNVLHDIFCQLFIACERTQDVARAEQWIRVGRAIAERRRLPVVAAFCSTHYGAIMTAAGRWEEADAALTEAVRLWGLGHRVLRAGALVRLADLRVRQGRIEEAEQLLAGLEGDPAAARPRAAIHLARGELQVACEVLERALDPLTGTSSEAVPLLALLVDVHLAAGDLPSAEAAASRLADCAERHPSDYHAASAALARARVCLAGGAGDANACLRAALAGFARANLPMELAGARLQLAGALVEDRPEAAMAEARGALDAFERLRAARQADAAAALLRSLGAHATVARGRSGDVLTKREAEVLDLLGAGLSNREIAERPYISPKTAEHHVARVLLKLGVRSRAEAAAYAVRERSGAR
jgi:DNA-binding CsgD family transcriptional regulator